MTAPLSRPNVLLIHCHDLGRHLGCYGAATVASPNLDRLAAEGVLAEQMFACAPQCSPSRAGLFTGRWPHANGVLGLTHRTFEWDLHPDERHLARLLADQGYATQAIGVVHEAKARSDEELATFLGFDEVRQRGHADEVVRNATDALRGLTAADRPYYLQVGFVEPHRLPGSRDPDGVMGFLGDHLSPDTERGVQVPGYLHDTESARAEIAELQGAIRAMDRGVGQLLSALDESGTAQDTIVIFTTDHGLALPRAKASLYDPGVEVAFLARWPAGGWTGGRRIAGALINIDVVPTLLEALDVPMTGGPHPHGGSFLPLLNNTADAAEVGREVIFGELTYHDYYDPRRSVRTCTHKVIMNFSSAPPYMDPSQSWRRRCSPVGLPNGNAGTHPSIELYDLEADPLELDNRADDPALASERSRLLWLLRDWMESTGDPLLVGAVASPLHRASLAELDR